MIQALEFLSAPIALGLLLVCIHAYLGLHVLERGVIFVDISLSQVAALGSVVSLFFIHEGESALFALSLSLFFCLTVSILLALLRKFEKNISQEALIGLTYAIASASLILVADRLPHGAEHIKEALIGNILFVTWKQVFETLIVYSLIGLFHYYYRKHFWRATKGMPGTFWWDFLFYFLFGVVITFSTKHAGVLVVFSILVAPAALASLFYPQRESKFLPSLLIAWGFGFLSVLIAFAVSFVMDFPAGASLVCVIVGMFFVILTLTHIFKLNRQHIE